jgi:phosphoglycerate dehydrogenase-like enzyme
VGRGAVVDNAALVAALQTNRLAGAVLDVFDPEPLPPENPLWAMDNVIFSPHTAALSRHENARIVELFCDNLERFASGRPLRNAVNLIEFY